MAYIILVTHSTEISIGLIAIILANLFKSKIEIIERFIGVLARIWVLYFMALFISVQVFLFSKNNDCKSGKYHIKVDWKAVYGVNLAWVIAMYLIVVCAIVTGVLIIARRKRSNSV